MEKSWHSVKTLISWSDVKYCGGKVCVFLKNVANHPLTKPIVYITGGLLIGNKIMKNGYDATADLGFASFSLTRRT